MRGLAVVSMAAGALLLYRAVSFEASNPNPPFFAFEQTCLFFGFILLVIPLAFFYTKVSGGLKKADLKLLDWGLILFVLCLMPLLEIVDPSLLLWVMFVLSPAVFFRCAVGLYLGKKRSGGKA